MPSNSKEKAGQSHHHTGNRTRVSRESATRRKASRKYPLIAHEVERYAKTNAFVLKDNGSAHKGNKTGRPPVITQAIVQKLERAFVYDSTVEEACVDAGISKQTYYNFCKDNPDFLDRIEQLRNAPYLVLRKRVIAAAEHDADLALKILERRRKTEWSTRSEISHSGEVSDRHSVDPEQVVLIRQAMGNFARKIQKTAEE